MCQVMDCICLDFCSVVSLFVLFLTVAFCGVGGLVDLEPHTCSGLERG